MTMSYFEMRWPVTDPARPRPDLIREAAQDLDAELPGLGLKAVSAPVYTWHQNGRWLVARFAVTDEPLRAVA